MGSTKVWRISCSAGASLAAALLASRAAWAVDPFEIQVYDGTANAPGAPGIELHTNGVVRGPRAEAGPPELPMNHQLHFTLEPSYGVTSFWEIGGYFQTAVAAGSFEYAGVKLRSKLVTPPGWHKYLRLGLNFELSLLPQTFDKNEWGMELRPIFAFENDRVMLLLNPNVSTPLAGDEFHLGPHFEPGAKAIYKFEDRVGIGLEYYGDFGAIASPEPIDGQEHYIYEVVDLLAIPHFELNIGFGEGLTSSSNRFVAKMILGYTWERDTPRPKPR